MVITTKLNKGDKAWYIVNRVIVCQEVTRIDIGVYGETVEIKYSTTKDFNLPESVVAASMEDLFALLKAEFEAIKPTDGK